MIYIYPAIFHTNEDGSYTVHFPDLRGCITEGDNLEKAVYMAKDALGLWLEVAIDEGDTVPTASKPEDIVPGDGEFMTLVEVDLKRNDTTPVKRTVSLPKWLDAKAMEANLSYSKVLQEALQERLR